MRGRSERGRKTSGSIRCRCFTPPAAGFARSALCRRVVPWFCRPLSCGGHGSGGEYFNRVVLCGGGHAARSDRSTPSVVTLRQRNPCRRNATLSKPFSSRYGSRPGAARRWTTKTVLLFVLSFVCSRHLVLSSWALVIMVAAFSSPGSGLLCSPLVGGLPVRYLVIYATAFGLFAVIIRRANDCTIWRAVSMLRSWQSSRYFCE
jgi:hypothetical protein